MIIRAAQIIVQLPYECRQCGTHELSGTYIVTMTDLTFSDLRAAIYGEAGKQDPKPPFGWTVVNKKECYCEKCSK